MEVVQGGSGAGWCRVEVVQGGGGAGWCRVEVLKGRYGKGSLVELHGRVLHEENSL